MQWEASAESLEDGVLEERLVAHLEVGLGKDAAVAEGRRHAAVCLPLSTEIRIRHLLLLQNTVAGASSD